MFFGSIFNRSSRWAIASACFVTVQEDAGVVAPQFDVVGSHLERRRQQHLGIIEHFARDADAGEQPHRLDVIAMAQQKCADEFFGGRELAFTEETGRSDDIRRNRFQLPHVRGGDLSLPVVADHLVETFEHAPGGRQCWIDLYRALVGLDRARRILECDVTVAALLVETARPRVMALHVGERVEGVRDPSAVSLCQGEQVQHVAVFRVQRAQRYGGSDRLREAVHLDQAADPLHLELHAGGRRRRLRSHSHGLNPINERVDIAVHPSIVSQPLPWSPIRT